MNDFHLTSEQAEKIASARILFAHQSVGDNIVRGLRDAAATDPRLRLKMFHVDGPLLPAGNGLFDFYVGSDGHPDSKAAAFSAMLKRDADKGPSIAVIKYCYADVDNATDVNETFDHYRRTIASLKAQFPSDRFVHVTMPLTTADPAWKALIKKALRLPTASELNVKRNRFNDRLREAYEGIDPIFDLAEVESTHPDGSRACVTDAGRTIYTLAPEYTDDGGHLNTTGRRVAAERLLCVLARYVVSPVESVKAAVPESERLHPSFSG